MKVLLQNPNSGELKAVKVGWSWTLFFFSSFLGLPLFLRKLYGWGVFFLLVPLVLNFVPGDLDDPDEAEGAALLFILTLIIEFCLFIFIAIKGNEMTAKNLLEKGWKFVHPDAIETQFAKRKWGLM